MNPSDSIWLADWLRLLTLADYNTRVVLLGSALLGLASGVVGSFMLLRKRALFGDAISHATLPGIAIAFLIMNAMGGDARSLPGLLVGAAVAGTLGMLSVVGIRAHTRLKEDTALGIVLSVYFGIGVVLLGFIQGMSTASAAGLQSFIYGKTASMLAGDAWLLAWAACAVLVLCGLLFKELRLLCFDPDFARVNGWPVRGIDIALMSLVILVTTAGLQAVGLILVIALLIIPPASARFWTDRLGAMVLIAGGLGALGCGLGAGLSAVVPDAPAGATIVMVQAGFFAVSLLFGIRRGVVMGWLSRRFFQRRMEMQHLLRTLYEDLESGQSTGVTEHVLRLRSWTPHHLEQLIRRAVKQGWITRRPGTDIRLTATGLETARRLTLNHRLWELYLVHYAEIAPSHVDRDADQIEHILGAEMVNRLKALARLEKPDSMPESPHPLHVAGGES